MRIKYITLKSYLLILVVFVHLVSKAQTSAYEYNEKGNLSYQSGKYKEALEYYDMAIFIDKTNAQYFTNRGSAYCQLWQYEMALRDCNTAIRMNSNNALSFYWRAYAKSGLGYFNEALDDYDTSLKLFSIANDKMWAFFQIGLTKFKQMKYDEAIQSFNQSLSLNAKFERALYWIGRCYHGMNNPGKATEYFKKAVAVNDDPLRTCLSKFYLGEKEIAITELIEIIKKTPENYYFYHLASLYAMMGNKENAMQNLDIAFSKGFRDNYWMLQDECFNSVRKNYNFIELLKKYNIKYNINEILANTPVSEIIVQEVKSRINKWREKGEFESSTAYIERIKTLDAQVQNTTQNVIGEIKSDYLSLIDLKNAQIGKYDPDGQSYELTIKGLKSIILNVPIEDAPQFKTDFQKYKISKKDLVISNDIWNISELVLTPPRGKKVYQYDIKNQVDYNPDKLFNLDFADLEIKVDQYDNLRSQKQTDSGPVSVGLSDVDLNIPVNKQLNNKTFAVIICNENYQKEVPVRFAANDGRVFKAYCEKTLGIPSNNIHLAVDATFGNMKSEIRWISDVAKAYNGEAKILFYYAGHGMPNEQTKSAYLLPVDGFSSDFETAIKLDDLYKKLNEFPTRGVTVFLDACFSGSQRDNGMLAEARGVKIKPVSNVLTGNKVVFSAASGDETAYPFKDKNHGLFTYYLLKKLQETKGDVTYGELYHYLKTNVNQQSVVVNQKSQTPQVNTGIEIQNSWQLFKLR
jgi:tetratricopeptide (TPR) repeat protein